MGIYSHNRVAGVAGNADLTMENFDFAPDFSIGCALEAVIQMHENDARMFDTLIECDFMEAENGFVMNESEAAAIKEAADEKKTSGIIDKIKAAIDKFIAFLQKVAGNVIAKFNDLVKTDEKLVAQFKDVLTVANLAEYKGIPNFTVPKIFSMKDRDPGFGEFAKIVDKFKVDAFESTTKSKEECDAILSKFRQESSAFVQKAQTSVDNMQGTKSDAWKFSTDSQIKAALDVLSNADKTAKQIKSDAKVILKNMKELERASKNMSKSFIVKKGAGEEVSANAKAVYDFVSEVIKTYSKLFNSYTNGMVKEYGQVRKAVILCGRAASKYSKGVRLEESAEIEMEMTMESVMCESSDTFVMEHFEYAY